ncbi:MULTISPECIES: polyamine ABC transporter substrate-binding protein [Brevibacterium]|uniref:Spermidine/putrescine transport system substrate-binding protein n=1 Tax=Brevibacterium salitolerans TaxID=1403566 RepID=A0ABN2WE77_9MICO|nr:spermidine/putrescine ABC transporter substrate-binding protein [Brevibacterium sp.]
MSERNPVRVLAGHDTIGRLSRRTVLAGMGAAGLSLLASCGQRGMAESPAPDGQLESRLNVYSWGDYDPPELLEAWSADNDVRLQVDAFGSNEEMMAKLAASRGTSGYDIVVPTGIYIPTMVEHGLLQRLDHSLLPNLATMDPAFMDQTFDPGNVHSVCKAWGTTGFVYDAHRISGDPQSWQDFIDLAAGEASGATMLLEDAWEVCSIALAALGHDLNTVEPAELDEAAEIVVDRLAPHVRAYMGNANTAMAQGSFALMQAFNGDARQGMLEADDPERWRFVFPTPSANLWMDTWCIATGAQNPDAAHAFIDWIIGPEQALAETDYIGYSTGSTAFAEPGIEDGFELAEIIFPEQHVLDRLVASEMNEGMQRRVEILTDAQTRSGA